jgi:GDPmannose 4,6-dehydratase
MRNYRNAYGLFISNGILFNHESPRRASNFVTTKIIKNAVLISRGELERLELGNLDSQRDWGHSKDYVEAMQLILRHEEPDDFVVSTGTTRSIRDLCEIVFNKLGMDYLDYVVQNPKHMRPEELNYLCGDSTKIRQNLGWKPQYTFETMIEEMLESWVRYYEK